MMTVEAKKLTVQSVLAVCLFAAVLFLVLLPKASRVRKLAEDVKMTLADNQRLQTSVLTAKHSGDRLDEINEKLNRYKARALYQEDLPRVLDEIGATAQTARLSVLSLRALDEPRRIPGESFVEGALEIQQVIVSLKAEGQYPDMVQYFKALESLPYLTSVQTLSLKKADLRETLENEEPRLSVEVMIAVLMRVPPIKKTD